MVGQQLAVTLLGVPDDQTVLEMEEQRQQEQRNEVEERQAYKGMAKKAPVDIAAAFGVGAETDWRGYEGTSRTE